MASRDLDLIIRILKSRQNDASLKKIKDDVDRIQKQLSIKIDYGKQMAKGMNQASESTEKLRKNVNTLNKSFKDLGREAEVEVKKVKFSKLRESIEKTVGSVRRLTKQVGGFARDSIDSFRRVTDSVGPVTNAMTDMANMQVQVEKHTTNLDGLTSNLRTKYHSLGPTLGMVAGLFGSVSANMSATATQTLKTYEAIDALARKIREIQILGRLRGVLNLDQDIKSLKLFRFEVEKLRLDLAKIRGETVAGRDFGVTSKMVEDLRKARSEVELLSERYVKLGQNVKTLETLNNKFKEQASVTTKVVKTLGSYIRQSDKVKELPGKLQNTVTAYAKVRNEILRVLKEMGKLNTLGGMGADIYPKQFAESWRKVRAEFKTGSSEIGALLKKIEGLHSKTTQQIVDNNLKIAKSSIDSISSQKDDYAALESLTSRQRTSIDQLIQKYRELKVGLSDLKGGVLSSVAVQKLGNQVLKESEALLATLGPKYRTLVKEINAWTAAKLKGISTGKTFSIMLKDLSGSVDRLIAKERVLISASKVLGNEQNLLEKRLSLARQKAKLYSDAIIKLSESLLRLNPAIAKDAIQIKKLEVEMGKLAARSIEATKSVNTLSSALTRVSLRGGDAVRAMHRVSAEGFGSMIISQAAWMAGFQVVFGLLDKFKGALISVVDLQRAVTRAMRTTRSETMSTAEIYKAFTDAMVESRMRTGAAIEDLGEIMYQLGSAGLSAEESMAALESTLANIIGTEAEVRDITKLIAGLYNNFAESIVKVDGTMKSLSATSKEWTNSLIESATLTEKFTYINDLLVAAFRDNQVEMMEMRDGLKFMIQSGKAANLALDEMVGILAFLNNHMIKAGQAGRAMRVILSKLTKDAAGFAEAFKIDIDLQKPLDFLDIMRKLNVRYGGQAATVEELGKVFKKLGLRGAEAFNLIMRNVDVLEGTIGNLQDTLSGAATEMERIRLSDLASQATIAAANIEALLRNGMTPLSETLGTVVGGFNAASKGMKEMDNVSKGTISSLVKIAGALGTVAASGLLIKNLALIFKWFSTVLVTIIGHILKLGGVTTGVDVATKSLTRSFFSLSSVLKGLSVLLVIEGLIWVAKYFSTIAERAREASEEHKKFSEQYTAYANKLETIVPLLEKQSGLTKENEEVIKKLAVQVGYIIDKSKTHEEILKGLTKATEVYIDRMEKLSEVHKKAALTKELDAINSELFDLKRFGEIGVGVFEKLFIHTAKLFTQAGFGSGRPYVLELFDEIFLGEKNLIRVSDTIDKLNARIVSLTEKRELAAKYGLEDQLEKELQALYKVLLKYQLLEDELLKVASGNDKVADSIEGIGENASEIDKYSNSLLKGRTSSEEMIKTLERLSDHSKKFSSELSSLREALGTMNVMSDAFRGLGAIGTSSIGGILEKLKELKREESIKIFTKDIEFLSDRIKSMPEKDNEIKRLIKDAATLGKNGSKMIQQFYKEIDTLKKKQIELGRVSSQLKIDNLALQFSGLEVYAGEAERAISGLVSATGALQSKVDSSKSSITQARSELNKLRSEYRLAASGTDEYKDAQENIMVQRRIMSVLTERLTRHETKLFNEVGEGIRTFKEMQERTEKFIVSEEDARIELIKMRGALNLAESGSEGYTEALENVTNAQRDLSAASSQRIQMEYEEITNTLRLRNAYSGIERSIRDQISLLGSWQKTYREQQEMYEKEISGLGNSTEALKDKAKLYKDIEGSIKSQIQKLDEQYIKEEKLIDIAEKTGRLTASEAALDRLARMSWHEAERLKLQKEFKTVSEDHQGVLQTLDNKYDDSMTTLERGVARVKDAFNDLKVELETIAKFMGDKIIGDKEIVLKMKTEELDDVERRLSDLIGTTYTIDVKVNYIEGPGKPKYHGGLLMAQGGMVPARVTAGEGYIPPSTTMGHLNALNTLNGGRATNSVPSSIAKFHGPGGIDNIPALLPKGSYILSTKGMAAYERSVTQGATGFQEGGEVNEEILSSEGEATSEIGRFTIVVQKEDGSKEYPIYGSPSVLRELKEELETERLTKLH